MQPQVRSAAKWIFALSIPVGLAVFFNYAQREAQVEVDTFKKNQKEHPNTDQTTVENYALKEVGDDNHVRWQLIAARGVVQPVSRDVALDKVEVQYFDGATLKMSIKAPSAKANETTKYVCLNSSAKERVVASGEEGKAQLEASKVELKEKNKFVATGGVNILWPGVAKVTGNTASGIIEKGAEMKNVKISGNTHALVGHIQ